MSEVYCVNCRDERDVRIEKRRESFDVRGESTEVESSVAVCLTCGEDVYVEELDGHNLGRAYDAYRRRHDLLTAAEIKEMREKYELTQRALAQLLGWGNVTVNRYENGAIQTRGHDQLLRLLQDPENVRRILERPDTSLQDDVAERLRARIESLETPRHEHSLGECLAALLDSGEPSAANGYRRLDLEKMHQVVAFLAQQAKHFFKSKALKLLWYADFLAFKSQACSITGCVYEAAPLGPVPRHFDWLLVEMVGSGVLEITEIPFDTKDGGKFVGELYQPVGDPVTDRLSGLEVKCLKAVVDEFGELSSNKTIDRAHEEEAYKSVFEEGKPCKTIPYDLAETLSLEAVSE